MSNFIENNNNLTIEKYSLYSVVLRGDTKEYKEELKKLGGKWNPKLKDGPGWVFPLSKEAELQCLIDISNKKDKREIKQYKPIQENELIHEADVIEDLENRISTLFQTMNTSERLDFIERILKLAKL